MKLPSNLVYLFHLMKLRIKTTDEQTPSKGVSSFPLSLHCEKVCFYGSKNTIRNYTLWRTFSLFNLAKYSDKALQKVHILVVLNGWGKKTLKNLSIMK